MTRTTPRGVRNNNPLNIRINPANKWQGKVAEGENTDGAFEQFADPIMGLRAAMVLLINHYERRDADTVAKLVAIWAPPSENDVQAYVFAVATKLGVHPNDVIDVRDPNVLAPLVEAMVRHENGVQPYSRAQIEAAMVRAGIEPRRKPLRESRTIQGGQVAATGTAGATAVEAVQQQSQTVQESVTQAQEQVSTLAPFLDVAKWVLLALVLIGIGITIFARVDDRRKGLR